MEKAAVSVVCQQISDLIDELDPFAKSAWGVKHEVDLKVGVRLSLHGGGQIIITRTAGGRYEVKFGRNSKGGGFTVIGEKGGLTSKHLIPTIDALMDSKGKKAMVVFHGTPHDFEEFKLDHVGTGEGAQSYGWGLYFTETEGIATHYRDVLTVQQIKLVAPDGNEIDPNAPLNTMDGVESFVATVLVSNKGDYAAAERDIKQWSSASDAAPMLEALAALKAKGYTVAKPSGVIFEVTIPDGPYLLWDAPLLKQPKEVQKALLDAGVTAPEVAQEKAFTDDLFNALTTDAPASGKVQQPKNLKGSEVYHRVVKEKGSPREASKFLFTLGIKGIKYLDGGSRSDGSGTYNYVLFNDRDAKVTKKGSTARLLQRQAGQLVLWHGGNLDEAFDETMAHKKGRWEYGPGLYLTTHYDTAKKYAKGSRKLYRITIAQGRDAWDVNLEWESVVGFIKEHCIRSKQKDVTARLERLKKDTNGVKAAWFVASLANNEAIASSKSGIMRKFLVDSGVDYEIVDNAFGWGERMIVLYNMKKIIKKEVVRGSDKIDEFDLPTEFSKDE